MPAPKARRTRPSKPKGRNPVIAGRVPEPLHQQIKQAARASGRSMSEEMAWRVERSFEWEKQFGEIKKTLDEHEAQLKKSMQDHEAMLDRGAEAYLRSKGFSPVQDRDGKIWVGPGMPQEKYIALNPELEKVIERVVIQTLQKVKGS